MTPKLLLRIASILVAIHLAGHTIGHITWDKPEDPKLQEVVTEMKTHKAEFMGAVRGMGDYYNGYSLMMFGLFGMTVIILWVASGFINEQRSIARKVLIPIGLTYLFFGIVEYISFFPFAAGTSFVAGALILVAVLMNAKKRSAVPVTSL